MATGGLAAEGSAESPGPPITFVLERVPYPQTSARRRKNACKEEEGNGEEGYEEEGRSEEEEGEESHRQEGGSEEGHEEEEG